MSSISLQLLMKDLVQPFSIYARLRGITSTLCATLLLWHSIIICLMRNIALDENVTEISSHFSVTDQRFSWITHQFNFQYFIFNLNISRIIALIWISIKIILLYVADLFFQTNVLQHPIVLAHKKQLYCIVSHGYDVYAMER